MTPEEAYVIVIEDDVNNLMITTDLLRAVGVKYINSRASGRQGLKLAEQLPQVDLILLDIQLPYEDGYSVIQHIRANHRLKQTRVVAVTANGHPQEEARTRAAGFDGFIAKPLDFHHFPQQIRDILAGEEVWPSR